MLPDTELLPAWDDRLDWVREVGPLRSSEVLRGSIETDFAAVLAASSSRPAVSDLRKLWKERSQGAASPILVVAGYVADRGSRYAILGPHEDDMPVFDAEASRVEQVLTDALASTSPLGLVRDLRSRLQTFISGVAAGLRNEGLFATHVLETQSKERKDWAQLTVLSTKVRSLRGQALLEGLGFQVEVVSDGAVLREAAKGHRRAAAVLLREGETFDNPLNRLNNATAVAHGLLLAERESLQWLVVLGGPVVRLYPVDPDVGVGRKGQTQTFVELDLALLSDDEVGFLALLISPESFSSEGFIADLLAKSSDFAADLATRLRDRIYGDVIEPLSVAVANKMRVAEAPVEQQRALLDEAYHRSMIILFRLLFVAYAEDRRLLPYGVSERYTRNALKTLAKDLVNRHTGDFDSNATTLWDDLTQVWKVIDGGDLHDWGVPAYNGGLFTRDAEKNPSGAAVYGLELTNDVVGPVLRSLLVDETSDGVPGPVDFRSLSVREFGTIYEGLLESGLDIATTDLALDADENFVPATTDQIVVWRAGQVYFHSKSGSRKSTGSYFTKPFAVEHLLDSALEPAIDQHLERIQELLTAGRNKEAARNFFDFRVADLSMGSAHFLVAAIDRIEVRFSRFLAETPIPEVTEELGRLRQMAASQLGVAADVSGIDDGVLLRRQIARRCIYGIDINEIAVELARLAVWIHTFVPGLPLSFLNHGLVWGNSLTGVGTLDEIVTAIEDAQLREQREGTASADGLFSLQDVLRDFLTRAGDHLDALASLSDASIADVAEAAQLQAGIGRALEPLQALCDLVTAERTTRHLKAADPNKIWLIKGSALGVALDADELERAILRHPFLGRARETAPTVQATHLPVQFPEVFCREPSGFDVVLGNPPWEELVYEEIKFWLLHRPGLKGLKVSEQQKEIERLRQARPELYAEARSEQAASESARQVLEAGPYPGMNTGHADLYKAFTWRFLDVTRDRGSFGVVLPRNALFAAGSAPWRSAVLAHASFTNIAVLLNSKEWVFEGVDPRLTVALVAVAKDGRGDICLLGSFSSIQEWSSRTHPFALGLKDLRVWSPDIAIPALATESEARILECMYRHPRLDAMQIAEMRPLQGDFNQTTDAKYWLHDDSGDLSVYKGQSFDIWDPDRGSRFATAKANLIVAALLSKRTNQAKLASSPYFGKSVATPEDLQIWRPRIAFRDITNRTNTRTVVAALVPPGTVLTNKAPYLVTIRGTAREEAMLLGVLSSIPLDWFARRLVELSLNFHILNSLPIPLDEAPPQVSDRLALIAGRLAAIDERYAAWAAEVGVDVASVGSPAIKDDLIAELDALVSLLYGLDAPQVEELFASFHRGWDYKPRLAAVLKHYQYWSKQVH